VVCPMSVIAKPHKGRPWPKIGSKHHRNKIMFRTIITRADYKVFPSICYNISYKFLCPSIDLGADYIFIRDTINLWFLLHLTQTKALFAEDTSTI